MKEVSDQERIVFDAANNMEAAFQCGPRDVQRFAVIIREAINASTKQLRTQLATASLRLAAERENAEKAAARAELAQIQLAAANRKGEDLTVSGIAACGSLMKENDELKRQLAAAQAAAKAHNDINGDICHIDITDTAALDAAIAAERHKVTQDWHEQVAELITEHKEELAAATKELAGELNLTTRQLATERHTSAAATKPLVDALQHVRDIIRRYGLPEGAAKICDDALAQVI